MIRAFTVVFALIFPLAATAQDGGVKEPSALFQSAEDKDLSEFLWINRLLIVFADTDADPRFQEQVKRLESDEEALRTRDVIVLTDTNPAAKSPARQKLRPRGFQMVFLDKDGVVKLRKPFPWSIREITRSIDKTPLRDQEIRDRRGGS